MNDLINILNKEKQLYAYKINYNSTESYELFFVKGHLETVRVTDTCDRQVRIYVEHDGFLGEAEFFIYSSTTEDDIRAKLAETIEKAKLINNAMYVLHEKEIGNYTVESNFSQYEPSDLAARIAKLVFDANTIQNASLNSVEIFINRHTETVINSCGVNKTQIRFDAMVEAIPTYNGNKQSVELYQQYNFCVLDELALMEEIVDKLAQVKARYEAIKPSVIPSCACVFNRQEAAMLFETLVAELNYGTVYAHANVFSKGDAVQKNPTGDLITITMKGEAKGCIGSSKFDSDGMDLSQITLVENGNVVNYFGSNRFGQYLNEEPTGMLPCCEVNPGRSLPPHEYLEILSMSGLQVDFSTDYIGGEIRLAYYVKGDKRIPITGISISGSLKEILSNICMSEEITVFKNYRGPAKLYVTGMKIF